MNQTLEYSTAASDPTMPRITIAFGVILILMGLAGYFLTGMASVTALIPAFFGAPLAILGWIAFKPGARKHAMHVAAALALLGLGGTVPGVIKLIRAAGGAELARPPAVIVQSIMATLCLLFLVLCIRSFIAARRARTGG